MSRDVTKAEHAGGHALDLTFEDGRSGRVGLSGFAAKGGVFARFSDLEYFKQGALNEGLGTLCWPASRSSTQHPEAGSAAVRRVREVHRVAGVVAGTPRPRDCEGGGRRVRLQ